jgi:prepilin signal peptidase PulO-like enzyme (type II secretory pathway)
MGEKKDKFFIKAANLPPRFPVMATAFWWMFLDYIKAPGWAFGAMGLMLLLCWIVCIYEITTKKAKDIFEG